MIDSTADYMRVFFDTVIGYGEDHDLSSRLDPNKAVNAVTRRLLQDDDIFSLSNLQSGCAALAIISKKRVYLAHIWESEFWRSKEEFESRVVNPILHGYTDGDSNLVQEGVLKFKSGDNKGDFDRSVRNTVSVVLILRYASDTDVALEYRERAWQLQLRLQQEIKMFETRNKLHWADKRPKSQSQSRGRPIGGRLLIQYSAWNNVDQPAARPMAGIRLWVEDNEDATIKENWEALIGQTIPHAERERKAR